MAISDFSRPALLVTRSEVKSLLVFLVGEAEQTPTLGFPFFTQGGIIRLLLFGGHLSRQLLLPLYHLRTESDGIVRTSLSVHLELPPFPFELICVPSYCADVEYSY